MWAALHYMHAGSSGDSVDYEEMTSLEGDHGKGVWEG